MVNSLKEAIRNIIEIIGYRVEGRTFYIIGRITSIQIKICSNKWERSSKDYLGRNHCYIFSVPEQYQEEYEHCFELIILGYNIYGSKNSYIRRWKIGLKRRGENGMSLIKSTGEILRKEYRVWEKWMGIFGDVAQTTKVRK